jgi:F-type H+-transporting ATPase subunit delta
VTEGSIARRYARALAALATEANVVDRTVEDLARIAEVAAANDGEFLSIMANPAFHGAERRAALDAVLGRLGLLPLTERFLRLLLDKGRFDVVGDIHREFRDLADAAAGRVRAVVTTAAPLSVVTRAEVLVALGESTGKTVVLETRVDPSLLGGIVAQVGGKVIDASLRTRLEELQLALSSQSHTMFGPSQTAQG